jgi:hypothetical protein
MSHDRPGILIELERRRQHAIRRAFTRLHAPALGVACGAVGAIGFFGAAAIPLLTGAEDATVAHVSALGGVFRGFAVSWAGAAIGAAYGFGLGFLCGFAAATARNGALRFVVWKALADQRRWRRRRLLDEI